MMKSRPVLVDAIRAIHAGAWVVGVSGGADSVALLALLRERADLSLHVAHLDHQTRGPDSDADARFVQDLARQWNLPCTIARRDQIMATLIDPPANPSALYRAARLALFRSVVQTHTLRGVILAHHALDQAETVLHRLLRGSGYAGLSGMSPRAVVGGLVILRPLLAVDRQLLPEYLQDIGQSWRTDASNESNQYLRNRLRKMLKRHPSVQAAMIDLARACAELRDWSRSAAPVMHEQLECAMLAGLPAILGHESARRWLIERGVPIDGVSSEVVRRLVEMSRDAATPPRQDFPGPLRVRRRRGKVHVERRI